MAQKTLTTSYLTKKQINNENNKEISKNYPVVRRSRCRIRLSALIIVDKRAGESDVMQHFRPPFVTFNAPTACDLQTFCTFAAEFQIYSVMTEAKKAFKDWDISDFKNFTDMGGLQKFEESRSHRPFFVQSEGQTVWILTINSY